MHQNFACPAHVPTVFVSTSVCIDAGMYLISRAAKGRNDSEATDAASGPRQPTRMWENKYDYELYGESYGVRNRDTRMPDEGIRYGA